MWLDQSLGTQAVCSWGEVCFRPQSAVIILGNCSGAGPCPCGEERPWGWGEPGLWGELGKGPGGCSILGGCCGGIWAIKLWGLQGCSHSLHLCGLSMDLMVCQYGPGHWSFLGESEGRDRWLWRQTDPALRSPAVSPERGVHSSELKFPDGEGRPLPSQGYVRAK